jgi:hypothetical protein
MPPADAGGDAQGRGCGEDTSHATSELAEVRELLISACSAVLGVGAVDIEATFVANGGNSLAAVGVATRLAEASPDLSRLEPLLLVTILEEQPLSEVARQLVAPPEEATT